MKDILTYVGEKDNYESPLLNILTFSTKDILCMSMEGKDNEFGADGLGKF